MKYLFSLTASLAIAAPALAQDTADLTLVLTQRVPDESITVLATGSRQPLDQVGQSVTVIGADEIASVQGADLLRVLERVPGVTLTRNGGLGGFTGLRVRGADAEQLLVLVDGVRMNDVAAPGAGYDLGNLLSGGIGKIELLRGSNSVVWGSQAIGGVLAVTSREVNGVEASAEYGAHDTLDAGVNAGLIGEGHAVGLTAGFTRTDGISAAASGSEPDGFRQWRLGGRGRAELAAGFALVANARYSQSRLGIDGFPPPAFSFADTPEYQKTREMAGRAGLEYTGSALSLAAGYALSDTRRAYFDPTFSNDPNYVTKGRSQRADLMGRVDLAGDLTANFGADSEWTRFSSTFDARHKARLSSAHALLGWHGERLDIAGGVRIDDHSRFGNAWTFGGNASYRLAGAWRVRASYGEGFKTPTLFQLFSDFGNTALVPERSRSFDVGIEKGSREGQLHLALTAFRRDSRNLIDFVSCFGVSSGICAGRPFGTYDNVGKARAEGFEAELGAAVSPQFRAGLAYAYIKAVNRTAASANRGNALARRPRHALTASVDWITPLNGLELGADARLVGDSFDDAGNFTRLDGHALLTLRASLPLGERFEVFGRVENLTDAQYQTAAGYGTSGRAAYAGVRARF